MGLFASFRHYNDFSANKSAYGEGYKPVQLIRKPEGDFKGKRLGRGGRANVWVVIKIPDMTIYTLRDMCILSCTKKENARISSGTVRASFRQSFEGSTYYCEQRNDQGAKNPYFNKCLCNYVYGDPGWIYSKYRVTDDRVSF